MGDSVCATNEYGLILFLLACAVVVVLASIGAADAVLPKDLEWYPHAVDGKHDAEAMNAARIVDKVRASDGDPEGCLNQRHYCQANGRTVVICEDEATGLMGVLIMEGAKVITGFAVRGDRYENRQVEKGRWYDC